jgi:hypothetical protein
MTENFEIHPHFNSLEPSVLELLNDFNTTGVHVVKAERNEIKKFEIKGEYYNIKKFKTPNIFQSLVYRFIRPSKAKRSFEYGSKLLSLGINTPAPVAYLERISLGLKDSYYVSKHLDYDFDFRTLIHNPKWPNRDIILAQFAAFTFKLHENNINFLDHSPGNTLIVEAKQGKFDFYLIDLNRMRFQKMDLHARMKNFRRLWLSKHMIKIMAPVYASLCNESVREVFKWMSLYSGKFMKKANRKKLRRRRRNR